MAGVFTHSSRHPTFTEDVFAGNAGYRTSPLTSLFSSPRRLRESLAHCKDLLPPQTPLKSRSSLLRRTAILHYNIGPLSCRSMLVSPPSPYPAVELQNFGRDGLKKSATLFYSFYGQISSTPFEFCAWLDCHSQRRHHIYSSHEDINYLTSAVDRTSETTGTIARADAVDRLTHQYYN